MATPWFTSNTLIEAIKRKIAFPISQVTFDETDILAFANEEMAISQVPAILSFNEEFFTFTETIALEEGKDHYPIPTRAIGMKLRDVFYQDANGNLLEMTRVSQDDRAFYDRNIGANQAIHKFFIEGNDIVLIPKPTTGPSGSLVFVYYLRPNQLVEDDRAAIISSFCKDVTVVNASLSDGDTITIGDQIFTAVAAAPSTDEFLIDASSILTATNLAAAITANGIATASNSTPATDTVTVTFTDRNLTHETSNSSGLEISDQLCLITSTLPSHLATGDLVDFLQTDGGHRTYSINKEIQDLSTNAIYLLDSDVPENFIIGDYICSQHECIIPQIPSELHTSLSERTCARILASLGDTEAFNQTTMKIKENEMREGNLIDNRVTGAPQKITARNSLLRYGKLGSRRRR